MALARPSHQELLRSYRHLYKALLIAVQYSKPARYQVRDRLRIEFRTKEISNYDTTRISRTLEFLDAAAKSRGLEHRIVKNLVHVWWGQQDFRRVGAMPAEAMNFRKEAFEEFGHTVRMLEQNAGIYLGDSVLEPRRFNPEGPFPE